MENNIEEIIKSALQNHESPFDPSAWEAMSKRLDQTMPVGSAPKSPIKWSWVAAAVVAVGISAFFLIEKDRTSETQPKAKPLAVESETNHSTTTEQRPNNTSSKKIMQSFESVKETANSTNYKQENTANYTAPLDKFVNESSHVGGTKIPSNMPNSSTFSFVAPKVNDSYCQNEQITIVNENDELISVENESGRPIVILGKSTANIELQTIGTYTFVYKQHGKTHKQTAFQVKSKPKVDFVYDPDMLYDKGLPINNLKSAYTAENYTWKNAKGEVISNEKEFDIHLFTKGMHDVTLTVEDQNGCKNTVTKAVRCDFNYNLLAVTGFDPTSPDPRNNTFIPFALLEKQRNVRFEMVILDPKTGEKVFETKSADQPWDGVDIRTNQLVNQNSTFIWKVTIFNKAIGENSNTYQGSITRI